MAQGKGKRIIYIIYDDILEKKIKNTIKTRNKKMELTPTSIGIILGITLTITTSQYFYFKDIVFDNKEDDVYINDVIYNVSNYWGVSYKFCN